MTWAERIRPSRAEQHRAFVEQARATGVRPSPNNFAKWLTEQRLEEVARGWDEVKR